MTCRMRRIAAALIATAALSGPLPGNGEQSSRREAAESRLQTAISYYNAGRFQEAAQVLEALIKQTPANFEAEELLGLAYSGESRDRDAYPHLEKAVKIRPGSAPARANLAIVLARLGKNELAEAEFKKAIEAEPGNFSANHDLGEFYARAGKAKEAIPYLSRAQQTQPSSYGNGYDLALAYVEVGRWADARQQIEDLLKVRDTAELHDLLGEIEERSGNYVAAANEYQRAAQMDPSESNIFDWGSELLLHQTLNPAVGVFSEGVKRYPDSPRLAVGLGLALYWSGQYDAAVKALVRATDLSPSDPRPYYFLSKAYQHSHDQMDEVIDRFQRLAQLRPQDGRAAYYYAMSLWKGKQESPSGGSLDQAESLLKRAIRLEPTFAQAHLELANLYSQQRKYSESTSEYKQAIELDPKLADAYYRLGQAYVHLGEAELAKKEFQIHKQLYQQHLAEWDNRQQEIQHFVYTKRPDSGVNRKN